MLEKTHYTNGQQVWNLTRGILTFYYKSGNKKAEGPYSDKKMEGEWKFYSENGGLLQTGCFKHNLKHGPWTRYDTAGTVVYSEEFLEGKVVKKKCSIPLFSP